MFSSLQSGSWSELADDEDEYGSVDARGDAAPDPVRDEDEELTDGELNRKGTLFPDPPAEDAGDESIDPIRYESDVPGGDAGGVLFVEYTDAGREALGLEADFFGVDWLGLDIVKFRTKVQLGRGRRCN